MPVRKHRKNEQGQGASTQRRTAEQRADLLREVWRLLADRDYAGVEQLLSPLPLEDLIAEPELGCNLASAWSRLGKNDRAMELLPHLQAPCRRSGNPRLGRMRDMLEAIVYLHTGRPDQAELGFQRVLASASEAEDTAYVTMACVNLGIVAHIRGEWEESLIYQQRALATLQQRGREREMAHAYHNLALCYREMGLLGQASTHFERAYRLFKSHGSIDELAGVERERALLLSYMGDFRMAEALARRSLMREMAQGAHRAKGEVLRVLGIIAFARGDRDLARAHLDQALELAKDTRNVQLEGEVMEELADLERVDGNPEASRIALERAVELYRQIESPVRIARARERILAPRASARGSDRAAGAG